MSTEPLHRDWILLRRDFILHRRALLAAVLIYVAFQVYFVIVVRHPTLWLAFTCVYLSFFTVIPPNRDDRYGTAAWLCTFPVTRADVVRGRYVTAWALVVLSFGLALAVAAFVPGSAVSVATLLTPDRLLLAAGITTFIVALLLPFTIRFGFMGVLLMLVVLQLVGAGLFVVANLTGNMDAVERGIATPFRALAAGLAALREWLPGPLFHLALVLALALVNWASYRLSVALFRRREL